MTLRLSDDQATLLRARADLIGRILDEEMPRYAEAMRRLIVFLGMDGEHLLMSNDEAYDSMYAIASGSLTTVDEIAAQLAPRLHA